MHSEIVKTELLNLINQSGLLNNMGHKITPAILYKSMPTFQKHVSVYVKNWQLRTVYHNSSWTVPVTVKNFHLHSHLNLEEASCQPGNVCSYYHAKFRSPASVLWCLFLCF